MDSMTNISDLHTIDPHNKIAKNQVSFLLHRPALHKGSEPSILMIRYIL